MTDYSDHNDSSILRDLDAEYDVLRSTSKEQTEKNEALNQEVHILRGRSQVAERIQVEFQSEVEYLQQQLAEIKASHAVSLTKLKEDHAELVKELESRALSLEAELSEVQGKSAADKEELYKARRELSTFQDESQVAALKAELQEVMEDHAANRLACVQHQELNNILLKEKADLLMELHSNREHLETVDEKLKIYKSDMMEQSETIEELRESLAIAESEVAGLKAGPADAASRGNSLFAEVEDKRQAMLQKCSSLSKKYSEMKRDYSGKCDEISRLKLENLRLKRQWQEEADERDNRDVWLKDNYEIRIKELLKKVEDLKKEERPVFLNGDSKILAYVDQEIGKSRKEVGLLREEMERRSSTRLNEAKALYLARSELLTLKAELMSLRAENIVLRDKLEEANITDIPSPGKTMKRLKEVLLSANEDPGNSHLKDNSSDCTEDTNVVVGVDVSQSTSSMVPQVSSVLCSFPKPKQEEADNVSHLNEVSLSCEDVSQSKPVLSCGDPPVSSLICCPPKPKRLMKLEEMEKLQLEQANSNKTIEETEAMQTVHLSPSLTSKEESSDLVDLQGGITDPNNSKQDEKFLSPSVMQPIPMIEKRIQERTRSEMEASTTWPMKIMACADRAVSVNPHIPIVDLEKPSENVPGIPEDMVPRRSILAKLSRPSLIPIDQNAMSRKVRFAEDVSPSCGALKSEESDSNVQLTSKKKPSRIPPPKSFKTKIVVSRETVYQQ